VSTRHLALAVIAVAVLAMGVYLFVEVRSSADAGPAPEPEAAAVSPTPAAPSAPEARVADTPRPTPRGLTAKQPAPAPVQAPAIEHGETPELTADELSKPNPKLDAIMDQANKAYDRQDYDEAKAIAGKVLSKQPGNVRMLRIMVSSSCIDGDMAVAQKYFPQLPKFDREQMKSRCDRYGVTLTDPPQ
jgi:hypothetical protein